MSAYYRSHLYEDVHPTQNLSTNTEATEDAGAVVEESTPPIAQGSTPTAAVNVVNGRPRYCTVKGCTVVLLPDYLHKMCEACRGRHRTYAMTKRAKRKMEKAVMGSQGGQPVVWMPPDDTVDGEDEGREDQGPAMPSAGVATRSGNENPETFRYTPANWDHSAIDPLLFSHDSSLANALVLPGSSTSPHATPISVQRNPELLANISSGSGPAPLTADLSSMNLHTGMQIPLANLSPATFDRPGTVSPPGSNPPRLCSIKGCKALVSGGSFFKMCEPCRDRYRNYGITKRAKWKHEKRIAVAELQTMRDENNHRADAGLPPLQDSASTEWHEWQTDETARLQTSPPPSDTPGPSVPRPARMCTVSHCREILPPGYQFLRCDRHRLQNRHHSRLKRVRDKEVKAAAFSDWVVSVSMRKSSEAAEADEDDGEELAASLENEGTPGTGFPPAARGMRRTNHVCSIKACYNLLSPSNPWRMCDACRAKDRANRREKALRDSGVITTPAPRAPRKPKKSKIKSPADELGASQKEGGGEGQTAGGEGGEPPKPKKKKKKKTKKAAEVSGATATTVSSADGNDPLDPRDPGPSTSVVQNSPQATGIMFMSPLLPPDDIAVPDLPQSSAAVVEQPPLPESSPIVDSQGTSAHAADSVAAPSAASSTHPFQIVSAEEIVSRSAQGEGTSAVPKKRRKVKKTPATKAAAENTAEAAPTLSSSNVSSVPPAPIPVPADSVPVPDPPSLPAAPSPQRTDLPPQRAAPPPPPLGPQPQPPAPPSQPPGLPLSSAPEVSPPPQIPIDTPPPGLPYQPYYVPPYGMPYGGQPPPYPYGPYSSSYPYPPPPYGYQPPYPPYPQHYSYTPYGQQSYGAPPYAPGVSPPPPHLPPPPPLPGVSPPTPARAPLPGQSMYSKSADFVSRADYAARSEQEQSGTTSGASSAVSSYYATFSAKTGEPQSRPLFGGRKKRPFEGEGMFDTNKKRLAASGHPVEQLNVPVTSTVSISSQAVASSDVTPEVTPEAEHSNTGLVIDAAEQTVCSNKKCRRVLPASHAATLCPRCRERLKKRSEKAKHRFRLEPRKLVGPQGLDAAARDSPSDDG